MMANEDYVSTICETEPRTAALHSEAERIREATQQDGRFCANKVFHRQLKPQVSRLVGHGRPIARDRVIPREQLAAAIERRYRQLMYFCEWLHGVAISIKCFCGFAYGHIERN